ncbi:hypothetical protein FRC15_006156 [Serendipita sp. 397]|nr:hypothetical protein FRC15_006156 [Serendipita sp. 397]
MQLPFDLWEEMNTEGEWEEESVLTERTEDYRYEPPSYVDDDDDDDNTLFLPSPRVFTVHKEVINIQVPVVQRYISTPSDCPPPPPARSSSSSPLFNLAKLGLL